MFGKQIKSYLSLNRRNGLVRRLDGYLVRLHEVIENRNYDFHQNGENLVLEKLKRHLQPQVLFDVGANVGEWTAIASDLFPNASIHSFEIVPETFQRLLENCGQKPNVQLNRLGLSDIAGEIEVFFSPSRSGLASCVNNFAENFHGYQPQSVKAEVTTGDRYSAENGIKLIDFLKIDVEGFEGQVLRGFEGMLRAGTIRVIQFEYGYVSVATKFLLKDFYDFLKPFDMVIGKIYPTHVEFRDYRFEHEDFIGPNFLAVHTSLQSIIEDLSQ